jgi:hypothetical protein
MLELIIALVAAYFLITIVGPFVVAGIIVLFKKLNNKPTEEEKKAFREVFGIKD